MCIRDSFLEGVPLERGVLVVGPPSSGKTTFLRDVARSLSLGRFGPSRRVAVVDERGELGGYDLGPNADVLRGYPKAAGLDAAIRTLSPEVAVLDAVSYTHLLLPAGAHQQLVEHRHDDANGGYLKNQVHFHGGAPFFPVLCLQQQQAEGCLLYTSRCV